MLEKSQVLQAFSQGYASCTETQGEQEFLSLLLATKSSKDVLDSKRFLPWPTQPKENYILRLKQRTEGQIAKELVFIIVNRFQKGSMYTGWEFLTAKPSTKLFKSSDASSHAPAYIKISF